MSVQIQLRRGTADQWHAANPVLADGEPGIATDTRVYKIGDGETPWRDLPSVSQADAEAMIGDLEVRLSHTFAHLDGDQLTIDGDPVGPGAVGAQPAGDYVTADDLPTPPPAPFLVLDAGQSVPPDTPVGTLIFERIIL